MVVSKKVTTAKAGDPEAAELALRRRTMSLTMAEAAELPRYKELSRVLTTSSR
jgi:hypothetical protein